MRVLILAIDCLDYRLVERFQCISLKQEVSGVLDVSEYHDDLYSDVLTPALWSSFITGEKHMLRWYRERFLYRIGRRIIGAIGLRGLGRLIPRRFKYRLVDKRDLNGETLFDVVKPSIPLYIPGYNDEDWYHRKYDEALNNGGIKELVKTVTEIHNMKTTSLYRALDRDWLLLMIWLDIIDLYSHMFYPHRMEKVKHAYQIIERLFRKVRAKVSDTLILIVSDHGIDEYGHYPRAFWSMNIDLGWRPRTWTSFYSFILEVVGN